MLCILYCVEKLCHIVSHNSSVLQVFLVLCSLHLCIEVYSGCVLSIVIFCCVCCALYNCACVMPTVNLVVFYILRARVVCYIARCIVVYCVYNGYVL